MTNPEAQRAELRKILDRLRPGQLDLLIEMARSMVVDLEQEINDQTDLVLPEFAQNFSNRLLMHHAINEEKFKKKSFEYAIVAASRSAGRTARIVSSPTNPGRDVVIDRTDYSLKTEAAANISTTKIRISKLMEARWIRDCTSSADFARYVRTRVVGHLSEYQRILMLRAFDREADKVRYELIEIPRDLLLAVSRVEPDDFSPRTRGGNSSADIYDAGEKVFRMVLDGSVEKVTISGLLVSRCFVHANWTIPAIDGSEA